MRFKRRNFIVSQVRGIVNSVNVAYRWNVIYQNPPLSTLDFLTQKITHGLQDRALARPQGLTICVGDGLQHFTLGGSMDDKSRNSARTC